MLDQLRGWLNGNREFIPGVLLYQHLGENDSLKSLFNKGFSNYCNARLQAELLKICDTLKGKLAVVDNKETSKILIESSFKIAKPIKAEPSFAPPGEHTNPDLYTAYKLEADRAYKEAMNHRAILFSMLPADVFEDPNRQDLIDKRSSYAIAAVELYNKASALYDQANNSWKIVPPEASVELDQLPDISVKPKLDNLRKNVNKLKLREQTPERVILIQKHQADILKLEERWLSLKPKT